MKKKKNAFTLIELLAIIVILAIIAVITVPIILNIIENSRKGAASDSAYGYKDSVNKTYVAELQNHNKLKLDGTYTVKSDGSLEPTEDNTFGFGDSEYGNSLGVQVSGTVPSSGKLRYSNNVLNAGCVVIGEYKVTFGTDGKVNGTEKGDCTGYEFPSDVIDVGDNNEQNNGGNEQGGGSSTPSNPYLTTFDGNYTYYYIYDLDVLDSSLYAYTRVDGTKKEVCGVFGIGQAGTVCLANDSNGRSSDFEDCEEHEYYSSGDSTTNTCLTGYAKAKMNEMLSKGAANCSIGSSDNIFNLSCSNDNVYCDINEEGWVQCNNGPEDRTCSPEPYCG